MDNNIEKMVQLQIQIEKMKKSLGIDSLTYKHRDYDKQIEDFLVDDLHQSLTNWVINKTLAYHKTERKTVCTRLISDNTLEITYMDDGQIKWRISTSI